MSYILEALRKSEQERRDQDQSAPFAAGVVGVQSETKTSSNPWIWITVAVIISVNVLVVLFLFKDQWFSGREDDTSLVQSHSSAASLADVKVAQREGQVASSSSTYSSSQRQALSIKQHSQVPAIPDRYASKSVPAPMNEPSETEPDLNFSYSEADIIRPKIQSGSPVERSSISNEQTMSSQPESLVDNYQRYERSQAQAKHELVNVSSQKSSATSIRDHLTEGLDSPEVIKPNHSVSNLIAGQSVYSQRDADQLPKIRDLNEQQQRQIPAISFSGHLYSSRQSSRSVRFGNEKYKEGDWLNSSLQLIAVTEDGVVFALNNEPFYMSSFDEWAGL